MTRPRERRPAFRTIEGWAMGILLSAGAIRECDEHSCMKDRVDPHARDDHSRSVLAKSVYHAATKKTL
jgi:hypothetical protein